MLNKIKFFLVNLLYILTWIIAWLLFKAYFRLTKIDTRNIPKGGVILACNHRSNLDPVMLSAGANRPVAYMAKSELFRIPGLAQLITIYAAFPVERGKGDTQALDTAGNMLKTGYAVGMFPEGTRGTEDHIGRIKSGVAFVAASSGAPVVPVALINTEKSLGKGSKGIKPAHIKVIFGKPFTYKDVNPDNTTSKENIRAFNERLGVAIQELYDIIK